MPRLLAILAVATVALVAATAAAEDDFSFYLLAQIWPGAQVKAKFPDYVRGFTVHGLWPNYDDNSWPQFCGVWERRSRHRRRALTLAAQTRSAQRPVHRHSARRP